MGTGPEKAPSLKLNLLLPRKAQAVNLAKALEMIARFKGLPHYEVAVAQLYVISGKGKRELRKAVTRMVAAFEAYNVAINYGKADEIPAWKSA